MPHEIMDEITLWRKVKFIDLTHEIMFFPHAQDNDSNICTSTDDDIDKVSLKSAPYCNRNVLLSVFEYAFEEEGADRVIYIKSGFLFSKEVLLDKFEGQGDGYEIQTRLKGYEISIKEELNYLRNLNIKLGHNLNNSMNYPIQSMNKDIIHLSRVDLKYNWHCSIKVRSELIFSGLLKSDEGNYNQNIQKKNRVISDSVALLVPTKNDAIKIEDCALIKYLIPTLIKTITIKEVDRFKLITLYVGYDVNDLLQSPINQNYVRNVTPTFVKIKFIKLPRTKWLTFIWNFLFVQSVNEGHEYFLQLNDDIQFLSESWLSQIIRSLGPNETGVVGLNDSTWQCKLYTQALVNRKHYQIFRGHFYPLSLQNWYSDNWITFVYRDWGGRCVNEALVRNGQVDTRYSKCDQRNLKDSLLEGFRKLTN